MNLKKILAAAAFLIMAGLIGIGFLIYILTPPKAEPVKTNIIKPGDYEPKMWGVDYPHEYDTWQKTKEPRPAGKSKYKKGFDTDNITYDKLSEFPYMALLFNGWGFGIEYNEPRGHHYMLIDQSEIDQTRVKAGGACLTCKSPYMNELVKKYKSDIFKMPYMEAVSKIPEYHRTLGAACIDCHDNTTLEPKVTKWTLKEGLAAIGHENPTRQELRTLVCAQCHVTYVIPKDGEMKSTNVVFPWKNGKFGDISIENIIKFIKSDPANLEWKQSVTGFKLGFIRHPEFELFSKGSVHFKAQAACADCHMPYKRVGASKISDHNIMSPLKDDLRACLQCHTETPEWLKERVIAIQDRTMSLTSRAGYATAKAAKLFEMANKSAETGKTVETALYQKAKDFYEEAFYRTTFLGAENSLGFHNPQEAMRIAGDAVAFAGKAESLLRQGLEKAGVTVPSEINLELSKYLSERGTKKLNFKSEQEFNDPYGLESIFTPPQSKGVIK